MKYKALGLICILTALITGSVTAEIVFEENFDNSPPYSDGGNLPLAPGEIRFGQWHIVEEESIPRVVTSTEEALSQPRSLTIEGGTEGRTVVGLQFGFSNAEATETTDSLRVRLAVCAQPNSSAEILLYGREAFLGYAQLVMNESGAGYARAWFDGAAGADRYPLSAGVWYVIEMDFPEIPNADSQYTFRIFEKDGTTQIGGDATGKFYIPPNGNSSYKSLTLQSEKAGGIVRFDDISVETSPEANASHLKR